MDTEKKPLRKLFIAIALGGTFALAVPASASPIVIHDPAQPPPVPAGPSAPCLLQPAPINTGISVVWSLPDAWSALAWRVPLNGCAVCVQPSGLLISSVSFRVRWFAACNVQAEVSIVGTKSILGTCIVPDTTVVLCAPVTQTISSTGAGGVIHTITLPSPCCVSQEAFVLVRFTGFELCTAPSFLSPGLTAASGTCVSCDEFVSSLVADPAITDWCAVGAGSDPPLWIQIGTDCCAVASAPREGAGALRLEPVSPNPGTAQDLEVRFALANDEPATIDLVDVAGRRVATRDVGSLGAGAHAVRFGAEHPLPPGLYLVRLRQGASRVVTRVVLVR